MEGITSPLGSFFLISLLPICIYYCSPSISKHQLCQPLGSAFHVGVYCLRKDNAQLGKQEKALTKLVKHWGVFLSHGSCARISWHSPPQSQAHGCGWLPADGTQSLAVLLCAALFSSACKSFSYPGPDVAILDCRLANTVCFAQETQISFDLPEHCKGSDLLHRIRFILRN